MSPSFATQVTALRTTCTRFDDDAVARTTQCLRRLATASPRATQALVHYYHALLFLRAHPANAEVLALVDAALLRIERFLWHERARLPELFENTGLPFADIVTRFSHDCVRELLHHPQCAVAFEEFAEPALDLNAVLQLTLPILERSETTAGRSNEELLRALRVRPANLLPFLVAELSRLDDRPLIKDQLFDALDVTVRVTPASAAFSTAGNRLPMRELFFQPTPIKAFDAPALMNAPLPAARRMSGIQTTQTVQVVRDTMTLSVRETDPATYLDARSLRLFDLDRGISIAIFGMTHDRQLGLESYVGFTAFKNGMPVCYGGAWMLGARADFGMNIFEPYRGGESGYVMCQLLRVYRQLFGVRYFEVDAHQFGLDNPDGITSGAFWFYYRYGFRPINPTIKTDARREKVRLQAKPGARSSRRTLIGFTESNLALSFGGRTPPSLGLLTSRVTRMIRTTFGGDRLVAERECIRRFTASAGLRGRLTGDQRMVLAEMAMLACALGVVDVDGMHQLAQMVRAKPVDVFKYQGHLTAFLASRRVR